MKQNGLEALRTIRILLSSYPNIEEIVQLAAELESAVGISETAAKHWKKLVISCQKETAPWLNAKYNIALSLSKSDETSARKFLDQHRALYPEYGLEPYGTLLRSLHKKLGGFEMSTIHELACEFFRLPVDSDKFRLLGVVNSENINASAIKRAMRRRYMQLHASPMASSEDASLVKKYLGTITVELLHSAPKQTPLVEDSRQKLTPLDHSIIAALIAGGGWNNKTRSRLVSIAGFVFIDRWWTNAYLRSACRGRTKREGASFH